MTSNEQAYLSLLRAAIWNGSPDVISAPVDWKEIIRLCQIHGTGPLVFDQALRLPDNIGPDAALAMQMKQQCLTSMMAQQQWNGYIAKIWQSFADTAIRPVLLKGFGLAALYPLPYLRQWGDLDVWVGVDHYHEACGILRHTFPGIVHPLEEYDNYKHYNFEFPDGHIVELHRVSMEFVLPSDWKYWQTLEKQGMQGSSSIRIGDTEVLLPNDDFNILFTFMHALEHFCGTGMPMKQLCDLALLVHSVYGKADEPRRLEIASYLDKHLRALHVIEPWLLIGYVVVKALHLPASEWPLLIDKKSHRIVAKKTQKAGDLLFVRILTEGQSRKTVQAKNKGFRSVLHRKWYTFKQMWASHQSIRASFPSYARHLLWGHLRKGIHRTIRREEPYSHAKSTEL